MPIASGELFGVGHNVRGTGADGTSSLYPFGFGRTTINVGDWSKVTPNGIYLPPPGYDPADDYANHLHNGNAYDTPEYSDPGYYDPGSAGASVPTTPQKLEYIDAPYAEYYEMDKGTAYQEALANTAYQRKVKDLQAAGLNPVLGYTGSGAASFYGHDAAAASGGGMSYGSINSGKTEAWYDDPNVQRTLPYLANAVVSFFSGSKAAGNVAQQLTSLGIALR